MRRAGPRRFALFETPGSSARAPAQKTRTQTALLQYAKLYAAGQRDCQTAAPYAPAHTRIKTQSYQPMPYIAGLSIIAVPLTPALSPRRGGISRGSSAVWRVLASALPLLGERAGVRGTA